MNPTKPNRRFSLRSLFLLVSFSALGMGFWTSCVPWLTDDSEYIYISCDVPGAKVYLDDRYLGTAPIRIRGSAIGRRAPDWKHTDLGTEKLCIRSYGAFFPRSEPDKTPPLVWVQVDESIAPRVTIPFGSASICPSVRLMSWWDTLVVFHGEDRRDFDFYFKDDRPKPYLMLSATRSTGTNDIAIDAQVTAKWFGGGELGCVELILIIERMDKLEPAINQPVLKGPCPPGKNLPEWSFILPDPYPDEEIAVTAVARDRIMLTPSRTIFLSPLSIAPSNSKR